MILHWTPCKDSPPARWSQPQSDVLCCEWRGRVIECDMSTPGVEYEIPDECRDVIHKAWRDEEDGPLHVQVPSLGPLSEDVTIDHGDAKVLTWQ